jgi:uncharacterized protein (DUF934 family)
MMDAWSDALYAALATRSQALYKNKHVLPVAAWIASAQDDTISAADVVRGLSGRLAPNKALETLERLGESGVMVELPFPGRPHPRMFRRQSTLFWDVALEFASEAGMSTVGTPRTVPRDPSAR